MSKRVRVKPGKGQSSVGFIAGLVFCFIGLFIVIPTFGIFGIFWTVIAVVITVSHGFNAFSDKGIVSHEIIIDDDDRNREHNNYHDSNNNHDYDNHPDYVDNRKTPEERLSEIQSLYEKGIITENEYQQKRRQILEDI